jgi:PhzF family phenazine biosynthesis protein
MTIQLYFCDVFAERPFSGNSLSVVVHERPLAVSVMQALTRELRQFETAFLQPTADPWSFTTRVFDLTRELKFAGHPLLGAAAILHETRHPTERSCRWQLRIDERDVRVATERTSGGSLQASMDQGAPCFGAVTDPEQAERAAAAFALPASCLVPGLAPRVVSTGLRYLIVPIRSGLPDAKVVGSRLLPLLEELDAEFAYLVDVDAFEGRHWENDGSLEDIATGSAAGPVGALLVSAGLAQASIPIVLRQGRFVGRPSSLFVTVHEKANGEQRVEVAGPVTILSRGELRDDLV